LYRIGGGGLGLGAATETGSSAPIVFYTQATERARITSGGDFGIGTTSPGAKLDVSSSDGELVKIAGTTRNLFFRPDSGGVMIATGAAQTGVGTYYSAGSDLLYFMTGSTERARIDSLGNLLVGVTTDILANNRKLQVQGASAATLVATGTGGEPCAELWQKATSGDNKFLDFFTETSVTARGSVTYNRAGGLVAYNTTSDYRAKDIIGPVVDSGALIDSTPVYMGKMKGATQERPMFIAHEVPAYAHTGEKDAVDADGKPVYQQMDASALIPVMWAEIQSLRQRLAAANI
jgi:hypothetical protein